MILRHFIMQAHGSPRLTPSMRIALADLGLKRIAVIYPGTRRYPLSDQAEAVQLA